MKITLNAQILGGKWTTINLTGYNDIISITNKPDVNLNVDSKELLKAVTALQEEDK